MYIRYMRACTNTYTQMHTQTHVCTHKHMYAHTNTCMHTQTHVCTHKKASVSLPLSGHAIRHSRNARALKWASEPVQHNLLKPGLGTRRWTDRTPSAHGVGTRSPTWATADMKELPVTLPPRNKFPGTHSQLSQLVWWC